MSTQRRARQASIGLAVMGLHLAGLLVWWTAEHSMQLFRNHTPLASVAVWLPELPALGTNQSQPPKREQQTAQASSGLRGQRNSSAAVDTPTVDATTTSVSIGTPLTTEAPGSADIPAEISGPPALNLNLSRKAITSVAPPSFAEQSPFRGRLPATVERQIAGAAAQTGPWVEERIDNDHIRFRRGSTCVTMERPRAAVIDPFSEAMARIPWRTSLPENCQ